MFKKFFAAFLAASVFSSAPVPYYGEVFENMGYSPERDPVETAEIVIPKEWGKVYENYNEIQKQGGFDLWEYRGEKCVRYTYELKDLHARGNVIVCRGEIIGGDICSITLDGIMLPIEKEKIK